MKIIEYKWGREVKQGAFWITEEDYKGNEEKLKLYHWQKDVHNEFSDEKGYFLIRNSREETSFAKVVIEELVILIQQGFTLSDKAQTQYEYWGKRYAEEYEYVREREEKKRLEEERKARELAQTKIFYWCDKYGCQTSLEACDSCKRKYMIGCGARRIKATLNEKGQWVGAV